LRAESARRARWEVALYIINNESHRALDYWVDGLTDYNSCTHTQGYQPFHVKPPCPTLGRGAVRLATAETELQSTCWQTGGFPHCVGTRSAGKRRQGCKPDFNDAHEVEIGRTGGLSASCHKLPADAPDCIVHKPCKKNNTLDS
jgi:hypothetical protein